tara:strand:+ start:722 stop:985 length:264 start_codon:yes stop_codon:yes gene_type:complete
MSKAYRKHAVAKAIESWDISEWFSADSILPRAHEALPQSHMSINVYAVAKALTVLESKGVLSSRKSGGVKEYSRIEGVWDGRSHFHA